MPVHLVGSWPSSLKALSVQLVNFYVVDREVMCYRTSYGLRVLDALGRTPKMPFSGAVLFCRLDLAQSTRPGKPEFLSY